MIKLNHIYGTKNDYFIVILRNPKSKCYELHRSGWWSDIQDFDYLLNEGIPLFVFNSLTDVRHCARKIINVEIFN